MRDCPTCGQSVPGKPAARLADLFQDGTGKPLIGTPLGRRQMVLRGVIAKEEFKMGHLKGWQGRNNDHPIIEYPDGTYEVLPSLAETNWKS